MTAPAAGSKENIKAIVDNALSMLKTADNKGIMHMTTADFVLREDIAKLLAAQNDATYAKVMEALDGLEIDREASENHIRKVAKDNAQIQQALLSMEIDADDRHDVLDDVRQSIVKIFGKTDAKPEERQG